MNISLIFLGQTGAGPVYSFEMAKALANTHKCKLQIIISENIYNLNIWKKEFENSNVDFNIVKTYNHNNLSVFLQFFNFKRKYYIVSLVKRFNADIVYSPFVLLWARFIYFFLRKKRIVSTIHDVKLHDSYHNIADLFSKILNLGAMKFVDDIIILNHKDKAIVEKKYKKHTFVIPHACFNYYFSKQEINKKKINYKIGFLGRIEPYKGVDLLIDSFEKISHNNVQLLIAGNGNLDKLTMERIAKNKKISIINRYIEDTEFKTILDNIDFLVLPYKRASQSGVIPLSFAYGKMVVATNVGALTEQVPCGTGFIVPVDSEAIADIIDYIYSNEEIIPQMGTNARDYATQVLTWENSAKLFLENIII